MYSQVQIICIYNLTFTYDVSTINNVETTYNIHKNCMCIYIFKLNVQVHLKLITLKQITYLQDFLCECTCKFSVIFIM